MVDAEAPAAKRLARAGSFSGVWWKLGDPATVERRLRAVADEEVVALVHAYWTARRRRVAGWSRKLLLLLAPSLSARLRRATILARSKSAAAFARLHKMLDARDDQRLRLLVAEHKAKIGQFWGSHHNMHKLLQKYDPDAAAFAASSDHQPVAAAGRIKRSHSRLSFHIGDD